jgi:hypothetical protein
MASYSLPPMNRGSCYGCSQCVDISEGVKILAQLFQIAVVSHDHSATPYDREAFVVCALSGAQVGRIRIVYATEYMARRIEPADLGNRMRNVAQRFARIAQTRKLSVPSAGYRER